MPISIDEFNERSDESLQITAGTQMDEVLTFLGSNSEQAFTQTEIAEVTGIKRGSVGAVLSRLEDRDAVEHKGRYWAIAEDDRVAAYRAGADAGSASVTDDYYGEDI
ncbi:MarR family transcriptional regulator [Haloarchaeobius sp. HRN-SO-5]|uniref:MarR family transcriptional regulator n=1 Tax=Haloarchaeobius sp. HRN-SO-5 TaxID=3446118 RepID=UPI003EBDE4E9